MTVSVNIMLLFMFVTVMILLLVCTYIIKQWKYDEYVF